MHPPMMPEDESALAEPVETEPGAEGQSR
jgi:hypothetical protein